MAETIATETGDVLFLAVADGAGTAPLAEEGASMAVGSLLDFVQKQLAAGYLVDSLDVSCYGRWLGQFHAQLRRRCAKSGAQPKDYSTTLLAAVVAGNKSSYFQIGDGAIIRDDPGEAGQFCWMFWPEESEYANATYFATASDAADHLQVAIEDKPVTDIALFSDGLQRVALQLASRTVHRPFFDAMFGPLRSGGYGFSKEYQESLRSFLASPSVLERTDDDKSLVIATRSTSSF